MGDLGDLTSFLVEGNVADLSWLEVDAERYRRESPLPKQNLDIQPDLQALWDHQDKPSTTYLIPNVEVPHTMGDMSQVHGPLRAKPEEIRKLARVVLMRSPDMQRLRDALVQRFDFANLQANRQVLVEVLKERGLLGKLYIAASDFNCQTGHRLPGLFVRKYASEAPYVLAKPACTGCLFAQTNPLGGQNCAVFHKEIVLNVPYSDALAQAVEETQKAKGKEVQVAAGVSPKERIRLAMLAPSGGRPLASGAYEGQGTLYIPKTVPPVTPAVMEQQLIQAGELVRKKYFDSLFQRKAHSVVSFLQREMLKGYGREEVLKSLKISFPLADLQETRSAWAPVFSETGLYGHVYSTQESFEDCNEGADFLAKHNAGVRAIVEGPKCPSCIYNKVSRCMLYGKPLAKTASAVLTPETVEAVLLEQKTVGRITPWDARQASVWGVNPRYQLKAIHEIVAQAVAPVKQMGPTRLDILRGYHGGMPQGPMALGERAEVTAARKFLNEGLYGASLMRAMRLKFEGPQLVAASALLRPVLAEQGLQGIYYVDPSVYDDYGSGCDEAMRLHRSRLVKYAKVGPKCAGCVLQTRPGFCSKLNKELVTEPPYIDKTAQQKAILSSGSSMGVDEASLMRHPPNIMAEYQMQHGGMVVDVDEPPKAPDRMAFEFNNRKIGL